MGFGSSKVELNKEQLHKLEVQKNKSICKLRIYGEEIGFGFLCKMPKTENKVLITDQKTLNSKTLEDKKTLELLLNNDINKELFIDMKKERIKYESEKSELFFLEIKDDDELKNVDFIEIEDINNFNDYKKKDIYILPYELDGKDKFPTGKIEDIKENEKEKIIKHKCNNLGKNQLKSFFPILNLKSYKLIGINKEEKTGFFIMKEDLDAFNKIIEEKKALDISSKNVDKMKDSITEGDNEIYDKPSTMTGQVNEIFRKPSSGNNEHEIDRMVNENKNDVEKYKNNLIENDKIYTNNANIINNIIIIIKVNKEDTNKNVFFFDSLVKDKVKRENGFIKEIEKIEKMPNFELSISRPDNATEKHKEFFNSFIPKIEGNYIIELNIPDYISDCSYMFYNCPNLTDVDLSNFELSPVTKMNDMFNYCTNLTKVTFSREETKRLDNMAYMFNYCKNLKSIDFKNIDTENVTNMSGMFQNCEKLEELDLTNFCTPNVSSLNCMFNDCFNLKSIKFSHKFNNDKVLFMNYMFFGCENLEKLDLSYFSLNNSNIKEMECMFEGCDKLNEIFVNRDYSLYFKQIHDKQKDKFKQTILNKK